MLDPIFLVIGRLLSYADNRMLPRRGLYEENARYSPLLLVDNPVGDEDRMEIMDKGMLDLYRKDVSDNGYSEAIMIQGIDQKHHGGET